MKGIFALKKWEISEMLKGILLFLLFLLLLHFLRKDQVIQESLLEMDKSYCA
jgi:hypothetical protein